MLSGKSNNTGLQCDSAYIAIIWNYHGMIQYSNNMIVPYSDYNKMFFDDDIM